MPLVPLPDPDADPEPPHPLAPDIERVLAGLGAPPVPVLNLLAERWEEVVGPAAAGHCRPGGVRDGCLRIEVAEPAWASQLKWQEADVLRRIAELAPGGGVRRVEVRVRAGRP